MKYSNLHLSCIDDPITPHAYSPEKKTEKDHCLHSHLFIKISLFYSFSSNNTYCSSLITKTKTGYWVQQIWSRFHVSQRLIRDRFRWLYNHDVSDHTIPLPISWEKSPKQVSFVESDENLFRAIMFSPFQPFGAACKTLQLQTRSFLIRSVLEVRSGARDFSLTYSKTIQCFDQKRLCSDLLKNVNRLTKAISLKMTIEFSKQEILIWHRHCVFQFQFCRSTMWLFGETKDKRGKQGC